MKKIIRLIIVLLVIAGGAYWYFTRPIQMKDVQIDSTPSVGENDVVYFVDKEKSEVKFEIDEELRGKPFEVVGVTSEVEGSLILKDGVFSRDSIVIGDIYVDARTFKTDSEQRNNAIVRSIVKSTVEGQEYAKISNITIKRFEQDRENLNKYEMDLVGNLTLAGITKSINFDLDLYKNGEEFIAEVDAEIKRNDFGLAIPNVPFVANVPNEFDIEARLLLKK